MNADDDVCLCFHVSFRKLINFTRRRAVRRPSELSECFGAGTGCGWCRPMLRQIADTPAAELPSVDDIGPWVTANFPNSVECYAAGRAEHRASQKD